MLYQSWFVIAGFRNVLTLLSRQNAGGKDLNRNFPDIFDDEYLTRDEMEPESLAIVKWIESLQFVLSANFHGGSLVANYPYDSTPYEFCMWVLILLFYRD